ncbi:MAG: hypothetical protein R3229_16445 [Alphaproteobacteria bacterium]|nr:hypothetical protein [Alphaproteobacteria bacterium]
MAERLRYYLAFNNGLRVLDAGAGAPTEIGTFFEGKTLEHLMGCRERPEVVFAAVAFDGGYRSDDGGRSWDKVLDGDVRTFTVDPRDERVVYAGTGPVRLYRSEDGGRTWEPLDGLLAMPEAVQAKWDVPAGYRGRIPPHVRHIFVHPEDSDLIYLALEHGGIVRSGDGGMHWEDASDGIAYLDMHQLRNLPGSRERYFVSSARGFYASADAGATWRRTEAGMPYGDTELYSYSHEWLFMDGGALRMVVGGARGSPGVWRREETTPQGHILLSDDAGESWHAAADLPIDMPFAPWVLLHHPFEADVAFAGMGDGARGFGFDPKQRGQGGFYRTDDRGETWAPVLADLPSVLTAWVAAA